MDHEDYKNSLFNQEHETIKIAKTVHFQTKHHNIYTVEKCKKYLTPYNDKKYFASSLQALSFGHKDIPKLREE